MVLASLLINPERFLGGGVLLLGICYCMVSLFDLVADSPHRLSGAHWAAWVTAVSPGDGSPREPPIPGGRLLVATVSTIPGGRPDRGESLAEEAVWHLSVAAPERKDLLELHPPHPLNGL